MTLKEQIDLWSVVHFIGPMIINISLLLLGVEVKLSFYCSIVAVLVWELLDRLYNQLVYKYHPVVVFLSWLAKIWDRRGASYMDYVFGMIALMIINYKWLDIYQLILSVTCLIIVILAYLTNKNLDNRL